MESAAPGSRPVISAAQRPEQRIVDVGIERIGEPVPATLHGPHGHQFIVHTYENLPPAKAPPDGMHTSPTEN